MKKSFSPFRVVLFITICLLLLGSVILAVPSGKKNFWGYDFRFLSENKLMKIDTRHKVDVKKIIADVDTTMNEVPYDSLANKELMGKPGDANFKINDSDLLTYDDQGKLALKLFFLKLEDAAKKKIHILHYGDSQIEGDRMTGFLRQRLQTQFGGNGPGFIPAVNVYNTVAFTEVCSPNFVRYTNFGGERLHLSKNYGILNSVGRFTPEYHRDAQDTLPVTTAWVELSPNKYAYSRAKSYNNVYIHYFDCISPCKIRVYQNGNLIVTDSLKTDGEYHVYPLNFPKNPGKLKIEYDAKISPNILAYSLEGDVGVQMDHIGMRGSSGTFFGQINRNLAKTIYKEQNVDLVIMQFGGNSIPYLKDSSSVRNSVNMFRGQLLALKRLRPEAMIIVIGPSDMSTLVEGDYTTYPLLPYYVDYFKRMTKNLGAAYFDLYAAMGGKDSMVAWVNSGLAGADYIHFSNKGASIAAQKFYDALMTAFAKIKNE